MSERIEELTLLLMHLTSWDEESLFYDENDNSTTLLNNLINSGQYKDIKYGIKLCNKNIGFNGKFYTFPYFMTFFLKRFLKEKSN